MANPTAIIGAGLSGLVAANELRRAGHEVVVLEAGAVPGGRLATRRVEHSAADTGAQFFTVRSAEFEAFVAPLLADGLVLEWCRGFNEVDGYPRFAVRGGMQALAARLAGGLDVRTGTVVQAVGPAEGGGGPAAGGRRFDVTIGAAGGSTVLAAPAVLLTPPVPVAAGLLAAGGSAVALDPALAALSYHRVLALVVTLDRPSAVPPPGGHQSSDAAFSFIGDNRQKGISELSSVTFHLNHGLSAQHWDDDDDEIAATMLSWAEAWLGGATPLEVDLVRWPHSGPLTPWPEAVAEVAPGLLLAGDAFAGPKVEGAYLSGLAAGRRLVELAGA